MKAEERHKLKTNELAESLEHIPEFFQVHGKNITLGIVIVVVLLLAVVFWRKHQSSLSEQQAIQLGQVLSQIEQKKQDAAMYAQDEKSGAPYNVTGETSSLGTLAQGARSKGLQVSALLKQADTLHSQLLFSNTDLSADQKNTLFQQIQDIYNQVLRTYPEDVHATGAAHLGLGILAEEAGNWDKAREQYQTIIDVKDTAYAGTVYPIKAEKRLNQLNEISTPIVFPPAPAVRETPEASGAAEVQPDRSNAGTSAESPSVAPQGGGPAEAPAP